MGRTGGWEASKHLRVKQTIKRKKETKKTNSTNKQWPPQRPRNAKKNVSRSHEKLAKSRPKRTKNRPRSDLGRFGRINVVQGMATIAPKTARDGLRTPSWPLVGSSWPPSWPSWLPCWSSWTPSWQPEMIQTTFGAVPEPLSNARVSSNGVRIYFSSVFDAIVASPNLNFCQPVQCFVHFARS